MMGRHHAWFGVGVYAGTVALAVHHGWAPPTLAQDALGTVVAAGSALAPDLDEDHSLSGRANPVAWLPIFGGHRRRTHCLLAVAAVTVTAVICAGYRGSTAGLVGFMAVGGVAVLFPRLGDRWLTCVPVGAAAGYVAWRWVPGGWWLVAAVAGPYLSHLVGDQPWQLPLFLPLTDRRSRFWLWKVGGRGERWIVTPVVYVATCAAMAEAFIPPVEIWARTTFQAAVR